MPVRKVIFHGGTMDGRKSYVNTDTQVEVVIRTADPAHGDKYAYVERYRIEERADGGVFCWLRHRETVVSRGQFTLDAPRGGGER